MPITPNADQKHHTEIADDIDPAMYDDYEPTSFDRFCAQINRFQWLTLVIAMTALPAWFFISRQAAFAIVASAVLLSGFFPFITGTYRTITGRLWFGWKARVRGVISIALGSLALLLLFFAHQ